MTSIVIISILMVALVGATLAATPYLMPPTECFTVTVPPSAKRDPRVQAIYRSYVAGVCALTAIGMLATALVLPKAGNLMAAVTISGAVLVPLAASFALMLRARAQVRTLKQAEGWIVTDTRSAALIGDDSIPQPVPLGWELLHLIVVALLAACIMLTYDRLPAQLPMHADLGGSVTDYSAKSPRAMLFPLMEAVFLGVVFTFCHWSILNSKRPVDPAAPATSAFAYGQFARIQSLVMLVGGLVLNVGTAAALLLSWLDVITLETSSIFVTIIGLAFAAAEVWVSLRLGQSGGRMAAELRSNDGVARDDDHLYKLGVFYVNPDDPSVWVPKRFGVGWTINCARPVAWVVMGLLALVSALFIVGTLFLVG